MKVVGIVRHDLSFFSFFLTSLSVHLFTVEVKASSKASTPALLVTKYSLLDAKAQSRA